MAITYVGKSASQAYGAADITVTVPSGYAQNDLLLLLLDGRSATPATPSGWTSIATVSNTGSNPTYFRACYKVAGASESSVTVTDSGYQTAGIMLAFRGVNTDAPINTTNTDTGTTFSANGVTTTVDGCMIVVAAGFNDYVTGGDTSNYSGWANANLASITEACGELSTVGSPNYYGTGIAAAYGIKTAAGATGATTATTDSSDNCSAIVTIALAPSGTVQSAAADITTTSTAEAAGIVTKLAAAAVTVTSTAAAAGIVTKPVIAAVTTASTATSSGLVTKLATAAQTTTSTAVAGGIAIRMSSAAVTTTSTGSAAGLVTELASVTITTTSTATAASIVTKLATANITTTSTAASAGIAIKLASAAVNTTSTATAAGAIATPWMSASVTSASTAVASGIVVRVSATAVTTTSTATAAGIAIKLAISAVTTTSAATAAGIGIKISAAAVTTTSTAMAAALAVRIALSVQTTTSTATASGIVIKLAASAVTTAGTMTATADVSISLAAAAATTDIATATATLYTSSRLQDSAKLVVHLQAASLASHLASADLAASLPVCEIDIVLDNISLTAQQMGGITLGVTAMPIVSGTSISIYQGETLPIAVAVYDSTGSQATDLTVALFALKRLGADAIIRDCVIDGNRVEVELSEADTLALLAGQYQYEFRAKSATGDVDSLVIGRLTVMTGLITAAVAPTGD